MKNSLLLSSRLHFVLLILITAVAVYSYSLYQKSQSDLMRLKANPQAVAVDEDKALIAKVGVLIELPAKENPTVATISDISKLKDQAFFVRAANGDKILIYTTAKKAILYRPSTNKIIDVAPVNIGASQGAPQVAGTSASATPAPKK